MLETGCLGTLFTTYYSIQEEDLVDCCQLKSAAYDTHNIQYNALRHLHCVDPAD